VLVLGLHEETVAMEQYQFQTTRTGRTRKIVCGAEVYLTVNLMENGNVGEVFVKVGKAGSTLSGLMHALATTISAALQRGVPWPDLRDKFLESKFEPRNDRYTSLVDAIAQNIDDMIAELRELQDKKVGQKHFSYENS